MSTQETDGIEFDEVVSEGNYDRMISQIKSDIRQRLNTFIDYHTPVPETFDPFANAVDFRYYLCRMLASWRNHWTLTFCHFSSGEYGVSVDQSDGEELYRGSDQYVPESLVLALYYAAEKQGWEDDEPAEDPNLSIDPFEEE